MAILSIESAAKLISNYAAELYSGYDFALRAEVEDNKIVVTDGNAVETYIGPLDETSIKAYVRVWLQDAGAIDSHECGALDANGLERCCLPAGHDGKHRSPWGEF